MTDAAALPSPAAVIAGGRAVGVASEYEHVGLRDFDAAVPLHVADAPRQGKKKSKSEDAEDGAAVHCTLDAAAYP
jgi:hypothetical protein